MRRKLDPLIEELAAYLKLKAPAMAPVESLPLWERTAVVAARDFLSAAERVFDDPRRVLRYRNAQPLSQAGRFTKRAIARREAAKAKKAAKPKKTGSDG